MSVIAYADLNVDQVSQQIKTKTLELISTPVL